MGSGGYVAMLIEGKKMALNFLHRAVGNVKWFKLKLTIIGHSGSNRSAFYLYRAAIQALVARLIMHMCKHKKGCG